MIRTAYELASNPQYPLSSFKLLIKCQRMNGVRLIDGKDDCKAAGEFFEAITKAVVEKVAAVIASKNAMSILSDGSQAGKTKSDKEVVLIRVERNGKYNPILLKSMTLNLKILKVFLGGLYVEVGWSRYTSYES